MLEALDDGSDGLFVVLRSDNLSLDRMKALKETFGAKKTDNQHLLALRLDPADPDAKHNLERVLEQMQQQSQQPDGKQFQHRPCTTGVLPPRTRPAHASTTILAYALIQDVSVRQQTTNLRSSLAYVGSKSCCRARMGHL